MRKAEAEAIARQMAETAFQERPFMDEIALRHYLITEETRADVGRNNHTTYEAMYLKTYKSLQHKRQRTQPA